jgi:membrane-associated phospholipid phosphatase
VREKLSVSLRLSGLLTLLFAVVYGGANWLNSQRIDLHEFYFRWELGIPFVPWLIYVYLSLQLLLFLTIVVLDTQGLRLYAKAFTFATLAAAAAHLLLPARLGFPRPAVVPGYESIYRTLYALERPYNMVPSLHITYAAMTVLILTAEGGALWFRVVLWLWMALITASVLLVHQHHILDIAAGAALGSVAARYYRRERTAMVIR